MRPKTYMLHTLASATLAILTGACTHKDLNENAPTTIADNVQVVFDWSNAPEKEASTMVLYLYSDAHGMMDYRFNNTDGDVGKCGVSVDYLFLYAVEIKSVCTDKVFYLPHIE